MEEVKSKKRKCKENNFCKSVVLGTHLILHVVLFAIFITISIGLCVDYSAHIAHAFMVAKGSRDDRMKQTLTCIGPAVLNGGISTFLAFVLLSMSKSIIFLTFFKVFFLVVVFGLFHGLLFLPVVLSLVGPKSMANQGFARSSSIGH